MNIYQKAFKVKKNAKIELIAMNVIIMKIVKILIISLFTFTLQQMRA